jgi:hypothetical protein
MNSTNSASCSVVCVFPPFFFLFYPMLLLVGYFPCSNPLAVIDNGVLKPLATESDASTSVQWRCSVVLTAVMSQLVGVPPAMEFWRCLHSPCYKQGEE